MASAQPTKPEAPPGRAPPPADVPGNLWTRIPVPAIGALQPAARVSVIVAGPGPEELLSLTLAALDAQTYPHELLDVLIAGIPGADERLASEYLELAPRVAPTLGDSGGGPDDPSKAVADAADAARGEVLLFLACGTVPGETLVEAHARWHHAVADAVSVGLCRHAEAGAPAAREIAPARRARRLPALVGSRPGQEDEGLETYLEASRELTEPRPDLFRVAAADNLGVRTETYRAAGGLRDIGDALLARLDLAYRLSAAGVVFVPERSALAHGCPDGQGHELARPRVDGEGPAFDDSRLAQRAAALIPVPGFRPTSRRRFARPAMAVNVAAGEERASDLLETVDGVLGGRLADLELRIQIDPDHPEREVVEAACAADSRVSFGPPSTEVPGESPFHVSLPAIAVPDERTLADIHELMIQDGLGALHVTIPGERARAGMVEVVASGPLGRARRIADRQGRQLEVVLGELFGERWISGVEVSLRRRGAPEPRVTEHGPLASATDLVHERELHQRHRARADTLQARAERAARRAVRERMKAREERARAERLEAQLERTRATRTYRVLRAVKRRASAVRTRRSG